MYYTTKDFTFKTNEELDAELTRLYNEEGLEYVETINDNWFGKEHGGNAVIKFKVK